MIRITSRMPSSSARVRLSIDCSMNVAGRKIVVSISMPGSPGCISSIASSMPRVTSIVLAPRNFWTTSIRPGPSLTTASPHDRLVVLEDPAEVGRGAAPCRRARRRAPCRGPRRLRSAARGGCSAAGRRSRRSRPCRRRRRRSTAAGPASSASAVASITCSSGTPFAASFAGSTWTCRCWSRSPQMRPGPRRARAAGAARIFQ